jgi:predicted kinase
LVNGVPASGKSTLASSLAGALGLPLVAKDAIKDILLETVGAEDRAASRRLSAASYDLLWAVLDWMLDGGGGAVVDCNFHSGLAEERLRPILARAQPVVVHCHASPEAILQRYTRRVERGERHPGHFDAEFLGEMCAGTRSTSESPLDLTVPTLHVQTTDGYVPSLDTITAFVRAALS